jgi:hypothetical protein
VIRVLGLKLACLYTLSLSLSLCLSFLCIAQSFNPTQYPQPNVQLQDTRVSLLTCRLGICCIFLLSGEEEEWEESCSADGRFITLSCSADGMLSLTVEMSIPSALQDNMMRLLQRMLYL